MPSFAAVRTEYGLPEWSNTQGGAENVAPVPFWESVERRFEDTHRTQWEGAREEALLSDHWERHRELERRLGMRLPVSEFMSGQATSQRDSLKRFMDRVIPSDDINASLEGRPGVLTDDEYDKKLDELLSELPDRLRGVRRSREILAARDAQWGAIRARADEAADSGAAGWWGSLVGGIGGTMADPREAGMVVFTGWWGAGRSLIQRMAAQGAIGAGQAVLGGGDRIAEAELFGGPEVTAGDIATEAAFAGAGGMAFEGVGDVLKFATRPARRAIGWHKDPADRGLAQALATIERDEAVVGPGSFDQARDVLVGGGPAPLRPSGGTSLDDGLAALGPLRQSAAPGAGSRVPIPYGGRPAFFGEVSPANLTIDSSRLGLGADAAPLLSRSWKPDKAGRLLVFEDRAGALIVADGRRRVDLATRLAKPSAGPDRLDAVILREADGWTPREVRFLAAIKNALDPMAAARAMRGAPELIDDPSMPTTIDPALAQARAIARLSDEAFAEVEAGRLTTEAAATIGDVAGGRPDTHAALADLMTRARPAGQEEADALAHEGLMALLGDAIDEQLVIARGRLRGALARELRGEPELLAQLARQADAMDAAGLALVDSVAAHELAATGVAARLAWSDEGVDPFTAAAARVARGEDPAEAAKELVPGLRAAASEAEAAAIARLEFLMPPAPSQVAQRSLDGFDARGGSGPKGQITPKPEDAVLEGFNVVEARARVTALTRELTEVESAPDVAPDAVTLRAEQVERLRAGLAKAEAEVVAAERVHAAAARGLFEDLGDEDAVALDRAITRLLPCVPGGG